MQNASMPHTTEFISYLCKHQEQLFNELGDDAYNVFADVPEVFVEQARTPAKPRFELNKDLVSDALYTGQRVSATDFFRIVLEDPALTEDGVQFKIRLQGVMDYTNGEMIAFNPANRGAGDWLKGFRSGLCIITEEDVQNGHVSEADFQTIKNYAKLWANLIEEKGDNAPYTKGHGNIRIWLTAADPEFIFTFQMELRMDPKTQEERIGIYGIEWDHATLIGSGVTQTTPSRIGRAKQQKTVSTNVKVSSPFRPKELAEDEDTVVAVNSPSRRSAQ